VRRWLLNAALAAIALGAVLLIAAGVYLLMLPGGGLGGTLREIGLGVKLSLRYSKPQILDMYLNAVYYGHGYWGDVAAARGYFGKSPYGLDWAQAALLAGLPQAPSAYDPLEHLELAKERQRHVLDRLVVNDYLTAAQANAAYAQPLGLR
jgi:membrane peptidoglycan carboxypeptidase